ncbi:thiF family protein [Methyloversatilis sp. RAC08]|uniref:tRNA threonylcarbamoyladenosine dehydratase n=1 Tax=Methyloversatilis sp. RAC08 TaxID=1842540 RepID=UPI00083D82C7|nr:tRNA threonylcarbamoyladenosine dehydratase [Methyloversatilis sp. RAC08]AOF81772.1 thiF family protein [Methyloversatilis sp. RAC08]
MNSTHDERETPRAFSGVDRLHGRGAHAALERAAVLVVGIGGVGSWATEALARSGIGRIALADLDHVAESNINRQIQALVPTLGMAKTEAMAQRISAINPACVVTTIEDFVSPDNAAEVLGAQYDAVIDCTDQVSAKVAMGLHCHAMRIRLFMAGAAGGRTDPTRIRCADLAAAQGDALLARVRQLLRKSGQMNLPDKASFGIDVVFSPESMRRPEAQNCDTGSAPHGLNCAGYGSSVCVTGGFGFALAAATIDHLLAHRTAG